MENFINYINRPGKYLMTVTTKSCSLIPSNIRIEEAHYDGDMLIIETEEFTYGIDMISEAAEDDMGWVLECEDGVEYYFERMED